MYYEEKRMNFIFLSGKCSVVIGRLNLLLMFCLGILMIYKRIIYERVILVLNNV